MIFSNSDPAQIVCRKQLLCRLIELMERVLSERDRSIILVRCGIEDTGPMDYDGLSAYFGLNSAEEAAFQYQRAVSVVRAALAESEARRLDFLLSDALPAVQHIGMKKREAAE